MTFIVYKNDTVYQSAVSFTNPGVSITDPRKKKKMVKTNPKMVKRQFYFACLSRYNNPTFYKKKVPTSQSL